MSRRLGLLLFAALAAAGFAAPSAAQDDPCPVRSDVSRLEVPRFVSLKSDEARGRRGPSTNYPVRWVYRRAGLPVKVVDEAADWREIEDPAGDRVWVHTSLLTGARTVMTLRETALRTRPHDGAAEEALIQSGAILELRSCRDEWCRVSAQGFRGFVPMSAVWGLFSWERAASSDAPADPSTACRAAGS